MHGRFHKRYSQRLLCGSEVPDGSIVPPGFDHRSAWIGWLLAPRLATPTDTDRASTLKPATDCEGRRPWRRCWLAVLAAGTTGERGRAQ